MLQSRVPTQVLTPSGPPEPTSAKPQLQEYGSHASALAAGEGEPFP